MALKFREELVGKRFLAVKDSINDRSIAEWQWRAGVVRAVSHGSSADKKDLQVLVEFDGVDWQFRESIRVHDACQVFLVEKALVWARRPDPNGTGSEICWPALNFVTIVDRVGLASSTVQPIEFFLDHSVNFVEEKDYCCQDSRPAAASSVVASSSSSSAQPHGRPTTTAVVDRRLAELDEAVRQWLEYQDGQSILLTTPTVLMGYRVKVYRTEGTTQWYTAVIQQYNCQTKKLTILDDTVLEEHNEDPATTQIVLLDGVVESILKGIDQRIIPRRRARDKELTIGGGGCGHSSFGAAGGGGVGSSCGNLGGGGSSVQQSLTAIAGSAACAGSLSATTPSRNRALHASVAATGVQTAASDQVAKQDVPAGQHRSSKKQKSVAAATAHSRATVPAEEIHEPKRQAPTGSPVLVGREDKPSRRRHVSGKRSKQSVDLDRSSALGGTLVPSALSAPTIVRAKQSPAQAAVDVGSSCRGSDAARRSSKKAVVSLPPSLPPALSTDVVNPAACPSEEVQVRRLPVVSGGGGRHSDRVPAAGGSSSSRYADYHPAKLDDVQTIAVDSSDASAPDGSACCTVDASRLQPEMHFKKHHLLASAGDSGTAVASAAAGGPLAATAAPSEAHDKPGSASPTAGSESAGGAGSDKLSDCGSADAGSTSGYSTATVDALSPHRRERSSVASALRADILATVPTCDPAAPATAGVASPLQFGRSPSSEPVKVYRDPELLRQDEEARLDRLGLGRVRLNAEAALAAAAGSSSSSEQVPGMPGHLRPTVPPPPGRSDGGLQALVAAAAAAAATHGRGSAAISPAGSQHAAAAAVAAAAAAATVSSGVDQVATSSAQHLLSSIAAAQQLAQLEAASRSMGSFAVQQQQQQQMLLQHDLAALAQLQLLCQSKYSGGALGHGTLPWQYLAYEDLLRRSYRDALGSTGIAAAGLLNRERTDMSDKERSSVSRGAADGYTSGGSSSGADAVDCDRRSSPVGSEACPRLKRFRPATVKVECDAISAAESAVDQHFTESLRLATKKAPWSASRPQWQHSPSSHGGQPLHAAGYATPKGPADQLMPDVVSASRSRVDKRDAQSVADSAAPRFAVSAAESSPLANGIKAETGSGASRELKVPLHPATSPLEATASTGDSMQRMAEPGSIQLSDYRTLHDDDYTWRQTAVVRSANDPPHCPAQSLAGSDTRRHQEPNFSLYGFQPLPTKYISQEKLHRRLDKPPPPSALSPVKDEPCLTAALPPLGSNDGWRSSVPCPRVNSETTLRRADSEEEWACIDRSPSKHSSVRHASAPAAPAATTGRRKQQAVKREVNRASAPSDGQRKQAGRRKHRGSPAVAGRTPAPFSSTSLSASVTSIPSHPVIGFDPYQHLIQDGLVPNPMYLRSTLPAAGASAHCIGPAAVVDGKPAQQLVVPAEQHFSRKPSVANGWRMETSSATAAAGGSGDSDCSTAAAATDGGTDRPSSGTCATGSRRASGLPSATAIAPSIFAAVAASSLSSRDDSGHVVRHSFKSILESAMHKAYMQDLEEDRKKHLQASADEAGRAILETESDGNRRLSVLPLFAGACSNGPSAIVSPMSRGVGLSPPPMLSPNGDTQGSGADNSSNCRCGSSGDSSTSSSSVAAASAAAASAAVAAAVETDSDTLSAPSPPACAKNTFDSSNDDSSRAEAPVPAAPTHQHRHGDHRHHPKLKKAWLQRHSGEGGYMAAASTAAGVQLASTVLQDPTSSVMPASTLLPPPRDREPGPALLLPTTRSPVLLPSVPLGCGADDLSAADEVRASSPEAERFGHGETTSSASEAEIESTNSASKRAASSYGPGVKPKKLKTADGGPSSSSSSSGTAPLQPVAISKKRPRQSSLLRQNSTASSSRKDEGSDMDTDDSDTVLSAMQKRRCTAAISVLEYLSAAKARQTAAQDGIEKSIVEAGGSSSVPLPSARTAAAAAAAKLSVSQSFRQAGYCYQETPRLQKCRECKVTQKRRNQSMPNIFCRFADFRRLRMSKRGVLTTAGFSEPSDAKPEDWQLWIPSQAGEGRNPLHSVLPPLGVITAKYIIATVGDEFCKLVEQEKECQRWASSSDKILWKRAVQGVRETCDVCDTTLFNMHWVCLKCGFVVCMDCYRVKRNFSTKFGLAVSLVDGACVPGSRSWLTCSSNRQPHDASKLVPTQIIPGDALLKIGDMIHDVRKKHGIRANCPCGQSNDLSNEGSPADPCPSTSANTSNVPRNGILQLLEVVCQRYLPASEAPSKLSNEGEASDCTNESPESPCNRFVDPSHSSDEYTDDPLSFLADVASMARDKVLSSNGGSAANVCTENDVPDVSTDSSACNGNRSSDGAVEQSASYDYYQPRSGSFMTGRREHVPVCQLRETSRLYPDVPHSWLCDGRLLRLHDPRHERNFTLFHQRWRFGQPVMVSNVTTHMKIDELWSPAAFSEEFGHVKADLVNCRTGCVLNRPIKDFWDGFENQDRRIVDSEKQPMLLKLKDWPPGDDFSDMLPTRFKDLTDALPMPEYTHRDGFLNLASRLPAFFVKPDLGPKMYNAYGMAKFPRLGTTNLHLDVSDAVNVVVYVAHDPALEEDVLRCLSDSDVDDVTRQRLVQKKEAPGALWHIWDACDADKIRDLLNKVAAERGQHVEPNHDPIHDQSWYLDSVLRERLRNEYGVNGFAIVQCAGDAIFIPAGAPHQVQNLNGCIKVAEDFVSPEHLSHCFKLTQEFRHLSATHSNHEDKLQVKNIIYHAIKDAVAVLTETDATAGVSSNS